MTPTRKKLLILALAGSLLVASGFFVVRLIVNPAAFGPLIASFMQRTTGLHVSINGGVGLSFFPWLGVEVRGLVVDDLPGFPGQPFASVARADIKVRPLALLRGDLEVEGLRLSGLQVFLARDKDGRENWKALPIAKVSVEKDRVVVVKTDGERSSFRYLVRMAELTDATASFEDRAADTAFAVTNLNVRATDIKPGQPFAATLSLAATSRKPEVKATVTLAGETLVDPQAMHFSVRGARLRVQGAGAGLPMAAFDLEGAGNLDFTAENTHLTGRDLSLSGTVSGGRFPADGLTISLGGGFDLDSAQGALTCPGFTLGAPKTGFSATGTIQAANLNATPTGTLSLTVPPFDAKAFLTRAGVSLPPFEDAAALSKVGLTLQAAALENTEARLEISLSLDGAPIRITAQSTTKGPLRAAVGVAVGTLALDRYLPRADAPGAKASPPPNTATPAFPAKDDAIDLRLTAQRLEVKKLALTGLDLSASLRHGLTEVTRFKAGLAGGSLSGNLRAETTPAHPVSLHLEGVNLAAGTLLQALAGRQPLTGTAALRADLAAQAPDKDTLLRTLSGTTSLSLTNGRILGLNLSPEILSSPMRILTFGLGGGNEPASGDGSGTRVTSASLSAAIKNGVATTRDLQIQAPPHKVTGQGWVNLPQRTLDMQLLAHVAGVADIPVAVTGSLEDPSVKPDLAAIPAGAVTGAAGAAIRAVTEPGATAKGVLDSVNPMNLLPFGKKKK